MSGSETHCLSIAGTDGIGEAGVSADLAVFREFNCAGSSAITAVVAQNSERVLDIHPATEQSLAAQLAAIGEAVPVHAVKVGMTWSQELLEAVVRWLWEQRRPEGSAPVVVDPVGASSSGSPLATEGWFEAFRHFLIPLAALITPNRAEAEQLLAGEVREQDQVEAARALSDAFGCAVLLKGGHFEEGDTITDVLVELGGEAQRFEGSRLEGATDFHGTGCVLSSAITAGLACEKPLAEAVGDARNFLRQAMEKAFRWEHGGREWKRLRLKGYDTSA